MRSDLFSSACSFKVRGEITAVDDSTASMKSECVLLVFGVLFSPPNASALIILLNVQISSFGRWRGWNTKGAVQSTSKRTFLLWRGGHDGCKQSMFFIHLSPQMSWKPKHRQIYLAISTRACGTSFLRFHHLCYLILKCVSPFLSLYFWVQCRWHDTL